MTDRKRVAVCVSGHLRQVKQGFAAFIRNVISPNIDRFDFDFFIDTWDQGDWRSPPGEQRNLGMLDPEIIDWIRQHIKPPAFRIQQPIPWDTSRYDPYIKPGHQKKGTRGEHILGMYYKIMRANELKSDHERTLGFEYDTVMRWRTDFAFKEPLILAGELADDRVYDAVWVPEHKNNSDDWLFDAFAMGDSNSMNNYSVAFWALDIHIFGNRVFRPEPLLRYHMDHESIRVGILSSGWEILRA